MMGVIEVKKVGFLLLVILVFVLGGCKNTLPDSSDASSEGEISITDASNLVRQTLPSQNYEYYVQYEGDNTFEGKEYYVFRVYTVSSQTISESDGGEPLRMQFTHGVYYVDPFTKEVFQLSTGGDCLIK